MKQKIINAFKVLGFELEPLEDFGYSFEYEGVTYIWLKSPDDHFLNLSIPGLLKKSDTDELTYYKLIDKLNSTMKFVKVNNLYDKIWLFYEHQLTDEEDIEQTISDMIITLDGSFMMYREVMKAADENAERYEREFSTDEDISDAEVVIGEDEEDSNEECITNNDEED